MASPFANRKQPSLVCNLSGDTVRMLYSLSVVYRLDWTLLEPWSCGMPSWPDLASVPRPRWPLITRRLLRWPPMSRPPWRLLMRTPMKRSVQPVKLDVHSALFVSCTMGFTRIHAIDPLLQPGLAVLHTFPSLASFGIMLIQANSLGMLAAPAVHATVIASIAARYPCQGNADLAESSSGAARFWGCISQAADLSRTVPATRWDIDAAYAPDMTTGKM